MERRELSSDQHKGSEMIITLNSKGDWLLVEMSLDGADGHHVEGK